MKNQDRLLSRMLRVVLPLVIWGVHFFFCYAYAAVACERGGDPVAGLVVTSVLAVAAAAALAAMALRRVCGAASSRARARAAPGLEDWASLVSGALALVAIVWTCVPMLMVQVCSGPVSAV
ncbi:MAG: hypothetical protein ABW069_09755 [Duganella sp.]